MNLKFEEIEETVRNINEMEAIFQSVVIIACHKKRIRRFIELKDQVNEMLVKNVHRNREMRDEKKNVHYN